MDYTFNYQEQGTLVEFQESQALKQLLKLYVEEANKISDDNIAKWDHLTHSFPGLEKYNVDLLKDYVATANGKLKGDFVAINQLFPEFSFIKKNPLANKYNRDATGIVKSVGVYEYNERVKSDKYLDGLDDNTIYKANHYPEFTEDNMFNGDKTQVPMTWVKSVDGGKTYVPMTVQEISLYKRSEDRKKDKTGGRGDLTSNVDLKNATALQNAYRFLPTNKQVNNTQKNIKRDVEELFQLVDQVSALQKSLPKMPIKGIGGSLCSKSGKRIPEGHEGYNCDEIYKYNLVYKKVEPKIAQLKYDIANHKYIHKLAFMSKKLVKLDHEQGINATIGVSDLPTGIHGETQLMNSLYYVNTITGVGYSNVAYAAKPGGEVVSSGVYGKKQWSYQGGEEVEGWKPLFETYSSTKNAKASAKNGDYYLNKEDGKKYQYINGEHKELKEFPFVHSTRENLIFQLVEDISNPELQKVLQSNIEKYIDENQSLFELSKPKEQEAEVKKIKKAIDKIGEDAKANLLKVDNYKGLIKTTKEQINKLTYDFKNRDAEFAGKIKEIQNEFDAMGEPVYEGIDAWAQSDVDRYNAIVEKANILKGQYNAYLREKEGVSEEYDSYRNSLKSYYIGYTDAILKQENFIEDEKLLLEYHNLMNRNGHGLVGFGVKVWGQVNKILGTFESFLAEVPMALGEFQGDNALTATLRGWGEDFEQWRGNMPVLSDGGEVIGFTDGYKKDWNKYTEDLYSSIERPKQYDELDGIGDWVEWGFGTFAEFAPQLAIMWATGGTASLAVLGASAAGGALEQSRFEMNAGINDYTLAQRWIHGAIVGGSEILFERYTLNLIRKAKIGLKERLKGGFKDAVVKSLDYKNLARAGSGSLGEGLSEANTQLFGNNLADIAIMGRNKSIFEGVEEAFVAGLLIERGIALPGIGKRMIDPFVGGSFDSKMKSFKEQRVLLEQKLKNRDLTETDKKILTNQYLDVISKQSAFVSESIQNVDKMTSEEVQKLIDLDVQLHDIKQAEDNIKNDKTISDSKKIDDIKNNRKKEIDITRQKNEIVQKYEDPKTKEQREKEYAKNYKIVQDKLKKHNDRQRKRAGITSGGVVKNTGKMQEFETFAEQQNYFNDKLMETEAELQSELSELQSMLNDPKTSRVKKLQIQNAINVVREQITEARKEATEGSFAHGFIERNKNGTFRIILNKENSLADANGNIFVAAHEFLHSVLFETIGGDKTIRNNLGNALLDYVKTLDALKADGFNKKLSKYTYKNKKGKILRDDNFGEEAIVIMSESIMDGTLEFNEGFFTKIGDYIRQTLQRLGVPGFRNIKFNTGRDVYNFIKDYNASIQKNYESKAINRMMAFGARGKLVEGKQVNNQDFIQLSKRTTAAIDELGQMGWTNQTWKSQGSDFAIKEIKEGRMLDGLIRAQYKTENVPPEFVDLVYSELTQHIKNFKPEQNDSLFGWINSQLANKAGNVYNREFKRLEQEITAKDIDSRTKEGETKVQVAARRDSEIDRLETEDLSIQARIKARNRGDKDPVKTSKFRKKIGIETGGNLYNKVVDTVRKTLGTRLPKLSDPKFKKSLTDNFKVDLKTPIAKLLGTKEYKSNLIKNREAIVNAVSTADWVQVERLVPDKDKIFTKFVRKLTKIEDVQAAIDNDLLPPSALNIIKKGTAVSLYEKIMPTQEQFLKFYDPPGSIPSKKDPTKMVRSGLKGTRKDVLAEQIGSALALDATMQVSKEPDVQAKRVQIAELQGENLTKDDEARLSEVINRPSDVQFSKGKTSKSIKTFIKKQKAKLANSNNPLQMFVLETYEKALNLDLDAKDLGAVVYNVIEKKLTHLEDKAVLASMIKGEVIDNNYFDNLSSIIKQITVRDTRTFGYEQSVERLIRKVEKATTNEAKAEIIKSFLINEGKFIRTLGPDGKIVEGRVTTNDAIFNEIIKPLKVPGFKSVVMKTKTGKISYFINQKTGEKKPRTKIQYQGEDINTYEKVTNIKTNFKSSIPTIIKESESAINYVIDIVKDNSLTPAAKKSIIKGGANDQVAFVRKMGVPGIYIEGLRSKETTLDHNPTINDLTTLINEAIDGKITAENLRKELEKSTVNLIPKPVDEVLTLAGLKSTGEGRYDRPSVSSLLDGYNMRNTQFSKSKKAQTIDDAIFVSRKSNNPTRGISILDFDDTLATTKSKIKFTRPDGTKGKLNAEQYAATYEDLLGQGYTFDFSEFTKVVKGKTAPLFKKALKLQNKFGSENMFVLTARPAESAKAIYDFLKANGLNIPLKNITGLANSTADAKALWVADKVAEGYNDFYFADDALQNVQAVKNMLDQFDVKSKIQQAKIQFSKAENLSKEFNTIIQQTTGIQSILKFSDTQAKLRGRKTKYRSIIPASAQDFQGLLYNFLGKGKKGEKQFKFFKKALIDPFSRGIDELNASRQSTSNSFKTLLSNNKDIKKLLNKKIEDTNFTYDQAIRVYLWNKAGFEVPGLSKKDLNTLTSVIKNDGNLFQFAEEVGLLSKTKEGYFEPSEHWLAENINADLLQDGAIGDARSKFLSEFVENVDVIFSKENLNKIQAVYGNNFREALEDMIYRMKTGRNRPVGGGRLMNTYMNWVNNSVGAIMFFNMRSAILQTISTVNYINWSDNNPLKAAAVFANQKQYWKDFTMLFNSNFLKQRRSGNRRGINEAELSAAVAGSQNKAKAAIAWLLQKGFLPTQIADSFAIASGGATFYRNRVNALLKKTNEKTGKKYTREEAETQAFLDFQQVTEVSQQSSRPDMISQQQASPLGRLILSFQNTPMQYARIMNKAARDIANNRGDLKTNVSKIVYYGAIQGIIFGALQSALFAALGDEQEEEFDKKKERILNQMMDSVLSGIGFGGKAIATLKNTLLEYQKQRAKDVDEEFMTKSDHTYTILTALSFSPPIGSKLRKIYQSIQTEKYNRGIMKKRGFTLDNPAWSAVGHVIEAVTNVPLGRLANKMLNVENALDSRNETWKRVALILGWNTWDLGIQDQDILETKEQLRLEKENSAKLEKIRKNKQKLKEKYPDLTDEEIKIVVKSKEMMDLSKNEQYYLLKELGLSDEEILGLKKEKDRTDKIAEMYDDNSKMIDEFMLDPKSLEIKKPEKTKKRKSNVRSGVR